MTPTLRPLYGIDAADLRPDLVAALGARELLLAGPSRARLMQLTDDHVSKQSELALVDAATRVEISPSSRYVLVVDATAARVWSRGDATPVLALPRAPRSTIAATFVTLGETEAIVHEPLRADLDVYALPGGQRIFQGNTETFLIGAATALGGGTHIALLGHFKGEGKDSLSVIPATDFGEPPEVLFKRFRKKRPIADYAYTLGMGSAGIDALVVYRDPEDDEEPDDDDDDALPDPVAYADVRGHHGFYVRGIDGAVRGRLAWTGPISQYARLAAAPPWIAAECGDQVALVSLDGAPSSMIDARWLASSPDGSQVLVQQRDLQLAIIHLAAS